MSDNVTGLPKRGFTYHGGTPDSIGKTLGLEGHPMRFMDDFPASGGVRTKRSDSQVYAILVRNVSGVTLTPGRTVSWKAAFRGRRIDGFTTTTAQEVAGVVDDQLPAAGVANNDLFWLIVKGPVLIKTPLAAGAGSVFAEGDVLVALTAATSQATTAGRPAVLASAATTNTAAAIINRFARVMSAMTTAQTNTNMLVDLNIAP
jgi:ketosteroid isomerase-like protein